MKKALSLILCFIMVACVFVGCSKPASNKDGALIDVYLTEPIYDLDPARCYDDASLMKIIPLLFEGFTRLDEKGKVEYALLKSYEEYIDPITGKLTVELTLHDSAWSDGKMLQASDFLFAWKRILDPSANYSAASLLYDVENAYDVKNGDVSVDSLGVTAPAYNVLRVVFANNEVDVEEFLKVLASPALVPVRSDKAVNTDYWAKSTMTLYSNGPFRIRALKWEEQFTLERNEYYRRDVDKEEAYNKYVTPYRIVCNFVEEDELTALLDSNEIFFIGELPVSIRSQYEKEADTVSTLSTMSLAFNLNNELLDDAKVRQALSLALDRESIVDDILVFGEAADGLVPNTVKLGGSKKTFRSASGALISTTADVAKAESLLSSAGVSGGSITLTVKDNSQDVAVANYVASVWEGLGFDVTVEALSGAEVEDATYYNDAVTEKYESGDFDVILLDVTALGANAASVLAPYATGYSGGGIDMNDPSYAVYPHASGYVSAAYTDIIKRAYETGDSATRDQILTEAEKMLMEDMPITPLVYLEDAYLVNENLSGLHYSVFGTVNFIDAELNNWKEFNGVVDEVKTDDTAAEDAADTTAE